MNWEAVSGIAESIGALGVIASLLYVGYQIRENTIATERTNARHTASDHARAVLSLQDEQTADIALRGLANLDSLNTLEQYRFDLLMTVWLEAIEQAYADYRLGVFPEDLIHEYRNRMAGALDSPGGRLWWERRKPWFSPPFREVIDGILANPPKEMENAGLIRAT
ncbi:MAG: hypothetical protein RIC85_00905 [Gammaproteobacteria bacterium]